MTHFDRIFQSTPEAVHRDTLGVCRLEALGLTLGLFV